MKRIGVWTSLAIAVVLSTLPAYSATCSNATLKGAYGSQDTQQGYDANYYIVGLLKFDGAGNGTRPWEAFQRNDQSSGFSEPLKFTYTVASDCTFTMYLGSLTFAGVVVDDGAQIRYVEITGSEFRTGNAVKVSSQNQQ